MGGESKSGLRHRRLPRIGKMAALAVIVGGLATACATTGGSDTSSENSELAIDQILTGEFETIDGPIIDLATVQNKDVVFWFWAPW